MKLLLSIFFLTACVTPQKATDTRPLVAVIGAGISGLAAARSLIASGDFRVVVFEASSVVGGRARTVKTKQGDVFDTGASWLHSSGENPLTPLAEEAGIKFAPTDEASPSLAYRSDGKELTLAERVQGRRRFYQLLHDLAEVPRQEDGLKNQSLQETFEYLFKKQTFSDTDLMLARQMMISEVEHEYGDDLDQISASTLKEEGANLLSTSNLYITNGFQKFAGYLAQGLDIRLRHAVVKIERTAKQKILLSIQDQKKLFVCDYAVVTVPLGVLKAGLIQFKPPLPEAKRRAIEHLGNGSFLKTALRFDKAFWPQDALWIWLKVDSPNKEWRQFLNMMPLMHKPWLVALHAGQAATRLQKMPAEKIKDAAFLALKTAFPQALRPQEILQTDWSAEPWIRGAYSFIKKSGGGSEFDDLAENIEGKLFFAGEATDRANYGTAHGAYLSGVRAAEEVIDELDESGSL